MSTELEYDIMELIIVTTALGNNGAERVLTLLANEWIREGNSVYVLEIGENDSKTSYVLDKKVKRINIHIERKNFLQWYFEEVREVVNFLKKHSNAIVISFLSQSFFIVALASLFVKNKILFSERNDPARWPASDLKRKMRDIAFCRATHCVFQTKEAMLYFSKNVQKRGSVIPNPCNPDLPQPYTGERNKVIITASRLEKQKNLPLLIKAFSILHNNNPDYKLAIYGEGTERKNLELLIKELQLQEFVFLPGFAKNIHEVMSHCCMYVCSSDYEGISNSMLEALALGLPTISTDCPIGGAREVIKHGYNGILVPVGDIDSLYQAMKRILNDKELANKLSFNARKVRQDYDIKIIAKYWLDIIKRML